MLGVVVRSSLVFLACCIFLTLTFGFIAWDATWFSDHGHNAVSGRVLVIFLSGVATSFYSMFSIVGGFHD